MKPEELLYAKSHEWVHFETDQAGETVATVGLSQFALEALTDLVFMELPGEGRTLDRDEVFGEIESVKAVSEMYAPVGGEVIAVNHDIADHLDRLAADPYIKGWLIKIRVTDDNRSALMDFETYEKQCESESH